MTTTKDPLEDIRERKQALLDEIQKAAGDDDKQLALQAKLRELRKEKAAHVATLTPDSGA